MQHKCVSRPVLFHDIHVFRLDFQFSVWDTKRSGPDASDVAITMDISGFEREGDPFVVALQQVGLN